MKTINLDDQIEQQYGQGYQHAKPEKKCSSSSTKIYFLAVCVRLFVAIFCLQTFHKGDEYFQGPEVAHKMVFGTGQLSWEWIFKDPIRGPLFPGFYAMGYYLLKLLRLDGYLVLFSNFAHIQQSFMAAFFDLLLVKINQRYNDKSTTPILLFFNWAGWTTITYVSRTYVNSAQVVITLAAFYFWIRKNEDKKYDIYSRLFASLGFVVRGTSVIFWIIVWPYQLLKDHSSTIQKALNFIKVNIITVVGMICTSVIISSLYYGKIIWVDYNFFYYNLLLNWSKLAGVSDPTQYFWHYQYKIFNFGTIFLAWGILLSFRPTKNQILNQRNAKFRQLFGINLLCILFLTYNQHKQLRFLLVYIPYLLIFIVRGFTQFPFRKLKRLLLVIFFVISIYEYVKRNFFVFNGAIQIVKYVRDNTHITNLYLLTGSFGMPMHAFIHRPINISQVQYRYDDAMQGRKPQKQQFYETPYSFLKKVNLKHPNLTHVITRKGEVDQLQIDMLNYDLQYQFKHPYFPDLALQYQIWRVVRDDTDSDLQNFNKQITTQQQAHQFMTEAIRIQQFSSSPLK